jgi:hypothetical protein
VSYTICATIADEPAFRLAGYGETHAAPRNPQDETCNHRLGAGCVGYAKDSQGKEDPYQPNTLTDEESTMK